MDKRGLILKVFGIIFLLLLVIAIAAGFYFYNYFVFKEFRICLGEAENSSLVCSNDTDCTSLVGIDYDSPDLADVPPFMIEKMEEIFGKALYCDSTCQLRQMRGFDPEGGGFEELESCFADEEEVVIEIKGKEGLQVAKYLKAQVGEEGNGNSEDEA